MNDSVAKLLERMPPVAIMGLITLYALSKCG